ncbi:hypothetical protein [Pyxidicoccus xibeiensis]|uniref:hypothetical protein n=1 Tax=Pyxidicoccus xibeiensis TaxID=2906759 RepID=UPI0020A78A25|nr:hypothetical protein [Pyxidicoccus xibeiensis]MCP3137790.1 hypothetical protein [Pyxidicoccus xibeiensis]
MRRFEQEALLDRVVARGALTALQLETLVRDLADFHAPAAVAGGDVPHGHPEQVLATMVRNFTQLEARVEAAEDLTELECLRQWTEQTYVR